MFFNIFTNLCMKKSETQSVNDESIESAKELLEKNEIHPQPFYLKNPLLLCAACCLVLVGVIAASWIIITVLEIKQLQEFSCLQDDQECLQLLCPQGMTWNEDVQECLLPDGWECCLDIQDQKICFDPQKRDKKSEKCSVQTTMAGISPFLKQLCRPGFLYIPRLKRCFRKVWRNRKSINTCKLTIVVQLYKQINN